MIKFVAYLWLAIAAGLLIWRATLLAPWEWRAVFELIFIMLFSIMTALALGLAVGI